MSSLIKQHGLYYVQFYNSKRRPKRKRVPLKTRTKQTALKLQRKPEDDFATGAFDPWLDENNLAKLSTEKLHVNNDGEEQEESINYFTKENVHY
ncbi:MAG: hypothetical protein MK198_10615 [Gracilimonas sp.]|jgi:hypothetical protein|uniref:hypothetical protein n=1 Tax=Gracilimonas sp. TaxID=1974203 RepID=UPI00375200F7|nr:hypothetical protein [Gracilimonas sp.]